MPGTYDSAFRTILNDCSAMILPLINEAFGECYTGSEKITFLQNEKTIAKKDGPREERITDSDFEVCGRQYHWECQSTPDKSMLIRLFEYDAQIALSGREPTRVVDGGIPLDVLTVRFPSTAVLYLRHPGRDAPRGYRIVIETASGSVTDEIPLIDAQRYSISEIFEKNLLLLVPFYIFSWEASFAECESDPERLMAMQDEYRDIIDRLELLVREKRITDFDRMTLLETADAVIREIAKNYQNIEKGMGDIMGGALLQTNAREIKNEGISQGISQGFATGMEEKGMKVYLNLIGAGISKEDAQRLAEIDDALAEKALRTWET